ncbi:hypothetical protein THIOKS13230005 [Thiocapsa sp. KS1]|nr:hypothetical protein [Thiocapsa sp. KS1]CRI66875.1 hypothetical protein THIOKS13230005 [Thiocapsa sp. KS1]
MERKNCTVYRVMPKGESNLKQFTAAEHRKPTPIRPPGRSIFVAENGSFLRATLALWALLTELFDYCLNAGRSGRVARFADRMAPMALTVLENLDIPPIPFDTARTAWQVATLSKRVAELGSVDALAAEMSARILTPVADAEPSELRRLHALYREVYTPEEVRRLVENGLHRLGLRPAI